MQPCPAPSTHIMPIIPRPDAVMAHGSGSWLWDEEGRLYLDLLQGWAVNCLGHAPPVIAQAIAAQAQRLLTPCPLFLTRPHLELATRLADATGLDHAFFCNSGAEANEGAIKLARKWGQLHRNGAFRIITCTEAFHGRTLATMSASGKPGWDALFEPKVPGFIRVPFGDIAAIERAITDEVVAVMLEPIQGEAGVVPLPAADLRRLRELTRTKGVLLILDEIQTGVGRTGRFLACQHAGVQPDILTLGKGLGGGVPIAALLARQVVSCFEPGDQGGTFNGNPLVCAAANAVLATVLAPGFLERVATAGARLEAGLKGLCDRHQLAGIRGQGLLWAIDLGAPRSAAVVARARNLGLLINGPRPHLLRLMPALTISDVEIDQALGRLDAALDDWL